MNPYLTHIDYPINIDKIKALARQRTQDIVSKDYASIPDQHGFNRITIKNNWEAYAQKIYYDFFDEYPTIDNYKPKIYFQAANYQVPFHTDTDANSAVNFVILDDVDETELLFEDGRTFKYRSAILNTNIRHSVITHLKKRILFKINSPEPYEDFVKRCKYVRQDDVHF